LSDNGGATPTMMPGAGFCAIDAGATFAPGTSPSDQRGPAFLRKFGAATDIGAVEAQPANERVFYDGFGL